MKKAKKWLALLVAAMMVFATFALTACGNEMEEAPAAEAAESESAAAPTRDAKDPFSEEVKIAYVPNRASDSVGAAWGIGLQNWFDNYPNVSFQIFDGEASADTQISIFADLLQQKYDAVIVQLVDSTAENNAIQELEDAGIPVLSLNIAPTIDHAARISLSSYKYGELAAEKAAELAGYKGNVVIVGFPPEVAKLMSDNPIQAWYDVIEKYPDMKILEEQPGNFTTEGGNEIMRDYLTKYDDIAIVNGGTDAMAEGCAMAIQSAGREGIQVWGMDGETKALEYIEDGLMTGTTYTNFYDMSKFAGQLAMYAIQSKVDLNGNQNVEGLGYKFPSMIVTKENVGDITEDMRW